MHLKQKIALHYIIILLLSTLAIIFIIPDDFFGPPLPTIIKKSHLLQEPNYYWNITDPEANFTIPDLISWQFDFRFNNSLEYYRMNDSIFLYLFVLREGYSGYFAITFTYFGRSAATNHEWVKISDLEYSSYTPFSSFGRSNTTVGLNSNSFYEILPINASVFAPGDNSILITASIRSEHFYDPDIYRHTIFIEFEIYCLEFYIYEYDRPAIVYYYDLPWEHPLNQALLHPKGNKLPLFSFSVVFSLPAAVLTIYMEQKVSKVFKNRYIGR